MTDEMVPATADARPTPWLAAGAVLVLAVLLVTIAVALRPARAGWDPQLWEVAQGAAKARGLSWTRPVPARTLRGGEFAEGVVLEDESGAVGREATEAITWLRAAGLLADEVDPAVVLDSVAAGGILAYYDPTSKTITRRGSDADLHVGAKVVLAHELVHGLQDQHYDLNHLEESIPDEAAGALRFLVEGDATLAEQNYYENLPREERDAWLKEQGGEGSLVDEAEAAELDEASSEIPPALGLILGAPYELGTAGVAAARATLGDAEVESWFRRPPLSEAMFLSIEQLGSRARPSAPDFSLRGSDQVVVAGQLGPAGDQAWAPAASPSGPLALALAAAGLEDPTVARSLVDAWRGQSTWIEVEDPAAACVAEAVDLQGPSASKARTALEEIAKLRDGQIGRRGNVTSITMCPDGTEYPFEDLLSPYVALYLRMSTFAAEAPDEGAAAARCIAEALSDRAAVNRFVGVVTSGEPESPLDQARRVRDLRRSCAAAN